MFFSRISQIIFFLFFVGIIGVFSFELDKPAHIVNIRGIDYLVHPGYIIQDYNHATNEIYASKGAKVYLSTDLGKTFNSLYTVPFTFELAAFASRFAIVRSLTGFHESIEVKVISQKKHLIIYGKSIFTWSKSSGLTKSTQELRRIGGNKLTLSQSVTQLPDGTLFLGEYGRNTKKNEISVLKSTDEGFTWEVATTLAGGLIRHIHTVAYNPFDRNVWLGTGDTSEQIFLGFIHDGVFNKVFKNKQDYRAVSFQFLGNKVFWGSDSPDIETNHIYSFDLNKNVLTNYGAVNGPVYYSYLNKNEEMYFATAHETLGIGMHNDNVSIWKKTDDGLEEVFTVPRANNTKRHSLIRFPKSNQYDGLIFSAHNISPKGAFLFVKS